MLKRIFHTAPPYRLLARIALPWLLLLGVLAPLKAQSPGLSFWRDLPPADLRREDSADLTDRLSAYRGLSLDLNRLREALRDVSDGSSIRLRFPLPDGSDRDFELSYAPIMPPALAARYPAIRTYFGKAVDGSSASLRLDLSPLGLHATLSSVEGTVYIDPFSAEQPRFYAAYRIEDYREPGGPPDFLCGTPDEAPPFDGILPGDDPDRVTPRAEGTVELQVYRLAMASTVEFTAFHGGTREGALAAIVSQVNRLNQVLERDLAIRLELVEEADSLIFVDADEYTNGNPGRMLEENPPIINQRIGVPAYDIGHVVGTHASLGGIAFLGGVCQPGNKARGASAMREPRGDPFVISLLAHEIGHQLGATHTFSSCHNINDITAYEPGGGTTIMSYAGICGNPINNLQERADPYYHTASIEQIRFTTRGGSGNSCAEVIPTENRVPSLRIEMPDGLFIPISTPFRLRASSSDADGDALTYTWEQFDRGPLNTLPGSPEGDSPLFRSLPPGPNPERAFPALEKILNGRSDRSEVLPTYSRALTFRCTVRDNVPTGGGLAWEQVSFRSDSTAGPFRILQPASSTPLPAGSQLEVRWDVAGTDGRRVNCRYVNVLLSTDGGRHFTDTLAWNAPNNGSAFVTVPPVPTGEARLMVEAADNIFFAVSDSSFAIHPATQAGFALEARPRGRGDHCLPDPLHFEITSSAFGQFDQSLALELEGDLPSGASYAFSRPVIQPSLEEGSMLRIELNQFVQDTFELFIRAVSETRDTFRRAIQFTTLSNDFSALRMLSPAPAERNITFPGPFTWTSVPDADSYLFELASSPAFRSEDIIRSAMLVDTFYQPDLRLPPDNIFFWRLTPHNACGAGPPTPVRAFQSGLNRCRVYEAQGVPVNIPGASQQDKPRAISVITVEENAMLNKVNVPRIQARYQPVRSLKMTLSSPEGTEITLLEPSCGGTQNFLTGFDDEAPDSLQCPPDDGLIVRPLDSLARFRGENIRGDWTLTVTVEEPGFGSAGSLQAWGLEFCAPLLPDDPVFARFDTLEVAPGLARTILPDQLEAESGAQEPRAIAYTLLSLPERGQLLLNDSPLTVGQSFTQEDINANRLAYQHLGEVEELDAFSFMVRDGLGGWLPEETFPIRIYQGALVDTDEPIQVASLFSLSPNPARDVLRLERKGPPMGSSLRIQLFSLQGTLLRSWQFDRPDPELRLSVGQLAAGTYLLQILADGFTHSEKLVIHP